MSGWTIVYETREQARAIPPLLCNLSDRGAVRQNRKEPAMEEHVYRTELTPVSFLARSASVFPDTTAVVHGTRRYSYRQLAERVNRLASGLRSAGLEMQD